MAGKRKAIAGDMTIAEASDYWDAHSVADFESHVVRFEYGPGERLTFVSIANDLLPQLERKARQRGVSLETLLNLWIHEKLSA